MTLKSRFHPANPRIILPILAVAGLGLVWGIQNLLPGSESEPAAINDSRIAAAADSRRPGAPNTGPAASASAPAAQAGSAVGPEASQPLRPIFNVREVMIPMRDGTRLQTMIYTPGPAPLVGQTADHSGAAPGAGGSQRASSLAETVGTAASPASVAVAASARGTAAPPGSAASATPSATTAAVPAVAPAPLPILLARTPYGIAGSARTLQGAYKELTDDGYIFVFQNIRGRYKSEGSFVMIRPPRDRSDPRSFDEATDAYDTIEWLVNNVPGNNGRVGMLGVSYGGWLTAMALLEPHPALAAASPQAPPADMWLGDDFFHNGAFRLSYGFEYAARMETTKEQTAFEFDRYDTFDWYLALGPLSNVNAKHLKGAIPTWNDFVEHPAYDEFWQRQTLVPHLTGVPVPVLNVAGWWDQEDFYGPLRIYDALERHDERGINFLVAGPWNHGGWNRAEGDSLGAIQFGSPTARYYREEIQAPWFAYYLKDEGARPEAEAWTFEVGTNEWRTWDEWPPLAETTARPLYFRADGRLSFEPPAEGRGHVQRGHVPGQAGETDAGAMIDPASEGGFDSYISDPAHPVPYRHRPIEATYFPAGSGWSTWLVQDQRFVDDRPDVLSWETEPLTEDVTIAGKIEARLFASTTGSDSDWVVKLIDVYPEEMPGAWPMAGYQLMVANEVFRGRYRNSFERPEPIPPDEIVAYTIDLHSQNYRFRKGHRIMVQVQSTWFPLIDRNPQTFVPNIFKAGEGDFRAATQRVWRSAAHPSCVVLPVVRDRR